MQGPIETVWNESRVAMLSELWFEGMHTGVIAKCLGVTKGMVCGKARRVGLPMRVPASWSGPRHLLVEERERKQRERAITRAARRAKRTAPFQQRRAEVIAERIKVIPVADMAIPYEQRKTLLELTDTCCRWPVGDPAQEGFFFCGGVSEKDSPYCPSHARRAYA